MDKETESVRHGYVDRAEDAMVAVVVSTSLVRARRV